MFWMTVGGTVAVIPLTVGAWLLVAREMGWPEKWDLAPLTGGFVIITVYLPVAIQRIAIDGLAISGQWLISWSLFGIMYAWAWQLLLEDAIVRRPDGIEPVPDRWPEWLQRGFER